MKRAFWNAFLMGCTGAWSLAPNQIDIARRVFSPDVKEVLFAKRIRSHARWRWCSHDRR